MLNLTFQLLKLFADGTLTASTVQLLANAAKSDGWGVEDQTAESLAKLGTSGRHVSNCLRDLLRLARKVGMMHGTAEPYYVEVPGANGRPRTVGVCLPHESADILTKRFQPKAFRASDQAWASEVGVGPLLRKWGNDVAVDNVREVFAVGLHADGVSYTTTVRAGNAKSVLVAAWNFISAPEDAHRGMRVLYFALNKASCCNCGCEGCLLIMGVLRSAVR